jgi:hypothetical protein
MVQHHCTYFLEEICICTHSYFEAILSHDILCALEVLLLATHATDLGHMHSISQPFALQVQAIHTAVKCGPFNTTYAHCIIDTAKPMSMFQNKHSLHTDDGEVPQVL